MIIFVVVFFLTLSNAVMKTISILPYLASV